MLAACDVVRLEASAVPVAPSTTRVLMTHRHDRGLARLLDPSRPSPDAQRRRRAPPGLEQTANEGEFELTFRSLSIATIAFACTLDLAAAAPIEGPVSHKRDMSVAPVEEGLAAYREYVKAQANTLVGMTRVLASAVKHGDLEAAQMTYAPAHRYLERIAPIARALHLNTRMDARADIYEKKEADPSFSGFHRIEYGLFANKSTSDLSDDTDRLAKNARELRDGLASLDLTPAALVDGTIRNLEDIADKSLTGGEERYSRTDLWDIEANIEGARQVVALLQSQPQARNTKVLASTAIHFAEIDRLIERHKVGCGFKSYDDLSGDDRMGLKVPIAALAEALSTLRSTLVMD